MKGKTEMIVIMKAFNRDTESLEGWILSTFKITN